MKIKKDVNLYGYQAYMAIEYALEMIQSLSMRGNSKAKELFAKWYYPNSYVFNYDRGYFLRADHQLMVNSNGELFHVCISSVEMNELISQIARLVKVMFSYDDALNEQMSKLIIAATKGGTDWNKPFDIVKQTAIEALILDYIHTHSEIDDKITSNKQEMKSIWSLFIK
jgi:hypothetical protein